MNPVLQREIRARWRTWPSILMLCGFALLMAADAALIVYRHLWDLSPPPGRILLSQISPFLIVLWTVLGPSLTATSISTERQKGLLQAVMLTQLSSHQICWGKWWSAMAFAGLMLLVPLPVMAISLVLGGVSPTEFLLISLLQIATLCCGSAVGLFVSTVFEKPSHSLAAALGIAAVVTPLPIFSPVIAAAQLMSSGAATFQNSTSTWPCVLSGFLLIIFTPLLVKNAAEIVSANFEPVHDPLQMGHSMAGAVLMPPMPPQAATEAASKGPEVVETDTNYGRWDLPVAKLIRFSNPVLQREVEMRFRIKAHPLRLAGPLTDSNTADAFTAGMTYIAVILLTVLGPGTVRAVVWGMGATTLTIGAPICGLLLGALTWTRERERNTLVPLRMLSYRPEDLVSAKLLAIVFACVFYAVPIIIPMLLCIRLDDTVGPRREVQPSTALTFFWFWLALTTALISWASLVSWRSRSSTRAVVVSIGGSILFGSVWFSTMGAHVTPALSATLTMITAATWFRLRAAIASRE